MFGSDRLLYSSLLKYMATKTPAGDYVGAERYAFFIDAPCESGRVLSGWAPFAPLKMKW